jgi:ABC-type dipeptide/oligopeptide/nickel transport system ATPase component
MQTLMFLITFLVLLITLFLFQSFRKQKRIYSLLGPTGSGKTSLIRNTFNLPKQPTCKTIKSSFYENNDFGIYDVPSLIMQKYEVQYQKYILFLVRFEGEFFVGEDQEIAYHFENIKHLIGPNLTFLINVNGKKKSIKFYENEIQKKMPEIDFSKSKTFLVDLNTDLTSILN